MSNRHLSLIMPQTEPRSFPQVLLFRSPRFQLLRLETSWSFLTSFFFSTPHRLYQEIMLVLPSKYNPEVYFSPRSLPPSYSIPQSSLLSSCESLLKPCLLLFPNLSRINTRANVSVKHESYPGPPLLEPSNGSTCPPEYRQQSIQWPRGPMWLPAGLVFLFSPTWRHRHNGLSAVPWTCQAQLPQRFRALPFAWNALPLTLSMTPPPWTISFDTAAPSP